MRGSQLLFTGMHVSNSIVSAQGSSQAFLPLFRPPARPLLPAGPPAPLRETARHPVYALHA